MTILQNLREMYQTKRKENEEYRERAREMNLRTYGVDPIDINIGKGYRFFAGYGRIGILSVFLPLIVPASALHIIGHENKWAREAYQEKACHYLSEDLSIQQQPGTFVCGDYDTGSIISTKRQPSDCFYGREKYTLVATTMEPDFSTAIPRGIRLKKVSCVPDENSKDIQEVQFYFSQDRIEELKEDPAAMKTLEDK